MKLIIVEGKPSATKDVAQMLCDAYASPTGPILNYDDAKTDTEMYGRDITLVYPVEARSHIEPDLVGSADEILHLQARWFKRRDSTEMA